MKLRLLLVIALALLAAIVFAHEEFDAALIEADAELDQEMEFAAEEEMNADEAAEEEAEEEVEEEVEEPVQVPLPATQTVPITQIAGVVQIPVAALQGFNSPAPNPYDQVKVVSGAQPIANGWALKQQGALQPMNTTDLFAYGYERIQKKLFNPFLLSKNYKMRSYSYVLVPGFGGAAADYFKPVRAALDSFGVHPVQVKTVPVDYTKSTVDNAAAVFKTLRETFLSLKNQTIVVVTHANGIVPLHAAYALYPEAAEFIHGLIPINPTWGGSALATGIVPKEAVKEAEALGFKASVSLKDLTHASRREFVGKYPVDYNALRILTVSTHDEKPVGPLAATTSYIKKLFNEINDGVSALSDQFIPGSRAIILPVGHNALVLPKFDPTFDQVAAIQSIFYSFFKTTP